MEIIEQYIKYLSDLGCFKSEEINTAQGKAIRWIVSFDGYEVTSDHFDIHNQYKSEYVEKGKEMHEAFLSFLREKIDRIGLSAIYSRLLRIQQSYSKYKIYEICKFSDMEYDSEISIMRTYLSNKSYEELGDNGIDYEDNYTFPDDEITYIYREKLDETSKNEIDELLQNNRFSYKGETLLNYIRCSKLCKLKELITWLEHQDLKINQDEEDEKLIPQDQTELLSIFLNNIELMKLFLKRCKSFHLEGKAIVMEVNVLIALGLINPEKVRKPLYTEMKGLGYKVTSMANWNYYIDTSNSIKSDIHYKPIIDVYKAFVQA